MQIVTYVLHKISMIAVKEEKPRQHGVNQDLTGTMGLCNRYSRSTCQASGPRQDPSLILIPQLAMGMCCQGSTRLRIIIVFVSE